MVLQSKPGTAPPPACLGVFDVEADVGRDLAAAFNYTPMFFQSAFSSSSSTFSRRCLHSSTRQSSWFWRSEKSSVPALYKLRKESYFTPTMMLIGVMPVFTFALGTWQLKRLKWKINLIDELEEKLQLQPLSLPSHIKFV